MVTLPTGEVVVLYAGDTHVMVTLPTGEVVVLYVDDTHVMVTLPTSEVVVLSAGDTSIMVVFTGAAVIIIFLSQVVQEWVGWRPYRPTVRVEKEIMTFDSGKTLQVSWGRLERGGSYKL